MAESRYERFYPRSEFTSLTGPVPIEILQTQLLALTLTVPIAEITLTATHGVIVRWQDIPTVGVGSDVEKVDNAIHAFAGGTTTSQPFEFNAFSATTTTSTTHQTKIDQTTPALEAGTYQVIWNSTIRMQAVIANTGVEGKIRVTRSDGVFVEQTDAWDLANGHAYNGALTFLISAGQTIRVQLTFARLGSSGTAEMSGVRITVDKLS